VQGVPIGALGCVAALLAGFTALLPRWVQLAEWASVNVFQRWLSVEARLASENLPRDVGRTAVTAGALMSGVALAIGFGTFTHSFTTSLTQWIYQTLPGDLFVTQSASMGGTSSRNVPMEAAFYDKLTTLSEVETARRTRIVDLPFRGYNIKAVSTDVSVYIKHARLSLLQGETQPVVAALRAGQVAVSENFSRHFGAKPGDEIELGTQLGTRKLEVAGVYVDYTSDVGTLLFDRATYVKLFHDDRVDTYELYLHDHTKAQEVRRAIYNLAGEHNDLNVLTSGEFRAAISNTTAGIFGLVRVLELVALIVAVLGIINTQYANVLDRSRELAVLRALGMLQKQLRRMVVIEAALVGAVGSSAGVVLGLLFGHVLINHINLVQTGWYFPFRLSLGSIAEATLLTTGAAALAGMYPAAEAARLNIAQSLASE
jgi:putative ABC transport system permease protein